MLLKINSACGFFLLGLIWIIQIVHYPTYLYIDNNKRILFQNFHTKTISYIVAPVMIIELISSFLILINQVNLQNIVILIIPVLIWLSTFCISVPIHKNINKSNFEMLAKKLIKTNWIRTILWTIKALIIFLFY